MMLPLALLALLGSIVVVAFLLLWHPHTHQGNGLDFCDCGAPATHELAGSITSHTDGGSAMVACYCKRHAPKDAVRV